MSNFILLWNSRISGVFKSTFIDYNNNNNNNNNNNILYIIILIIIIINEQSNLLCLVYLSS